MKTDKEFVDAVYEKYGRMRAEEKRREAARKRRFRYIGTLAACIILFVGIIGVTKLGKGNDIPVNGTDENALVQDVETTDDKSATEDMTQSENSTEPEQYNETDTTTADPFITDQGLVNEVSDKAGSIRGIELTKTTGNSYESIFYTDQSEIASLVEWLKSGAGPVMSEATFYSNYSAENMPATYYVMSVQFSADPADSVDVYVVTDTAPGF
ncbi:MAG: hypothetical protein IJT40_04315 [Firmicutes bacterium]|nr:hypothetical protein [Bacillota bacterium]MBQ7703580.1 hypothetical protein [Bacillota bacterium]